METLSQINAEPQPVSKRRIAFVGAKWHQDMVDECRKSFVATISGCQHAAYTVESFEVPGAFEIPLLARRLARKGQFEAVVGCALVVDGGIYRHEFVAQTVVGALMDVQLDTDVPMFSVVLTPHHFHDHADHQQYFLKHLETKGMEAATACVGMLSELSRVQSWNAR